eukprot:534786_1
MELTKLLDTISPHETKTAIDVILRLGSSSKRVALEAVEFLLCTRQDVHDIELLIEKANKGNMMAALVASEVVIDIDLKISLLKTAISLGSTIAPMQLGGLYILNKTVSSPQKAFKYYKIAADYGNNIAEHKIGYFFEEGIGTKKNITKAMQWYKISASRNNADSCNNLANCYSDLNNKDIAIKYYEKALALGNCEAVYNYGSLLLQMRENNPTFEKKALHLMQKAATEQNHASAYYAWGLLTAVDDIRKAFALMLKSVELGSKISELPGFIRITFEANAKHYLHQLLFGCKICQWISCHNSKQKQKRKNLKWYKCSMCVIVYYCSKRCQKLDWNKGYHKKFCGSPFIDIIE